MKASKALKELKQKVNISYHLCPEALKAIEDACADKPKPKKNKAGDV